MMKEERRGVYIVNIQGSLLNTTALLHTNCTFTIVHVHVAVCVILYVTHTGSSACTCTCRLSHCTRVVCHSHGSLSGYLFFCLLAGVVASEQSWSVGFLHTCPNSYKQTNKQTNKMNKQNNKGCSLMYL